MEFEFLIRRPIIVAIAGSNGSGKTTFYHAHLADSGLPFINADDLARELDIGPYEAAEVAGALRRAMVARRESFIFETVLSDPVADKVEFLHQAAKDGYEVVLIFFQGAFYQANIFGAGALTLHGIGQRRFNHVMCH